ncbi:MAG: HisA/HisF-related TIM barrel protein [Candidatus Bathyarchaeia archaeon]
MKIIPVIDILNGVAVHAVRGQRSQYQPLKSVLCTSAEPLVVASAFKECGFFDLYVADLDAILGRGENFSVLRQIAQQTGLKLMVDAGVSDLEGARRVLGCGVAKVIVGTETLPCLSFLKDAVECLGAEKVVVSLDLNAGNVLGKSEALRSLGALELAGQVQAAGVLELIALDLARVGSGEGTDIPLLDALLGGLNLRVLVGGGMRGINDLVLLKDRGVYGALVATALHSGKISIDALQHSGFLET